MLVSVFFRTHSKEIKKHIKLLTTIEANDKWGAELMPCVAARIAMTQRFSAVMDQYGNRTSVPTALWISLIRPIIRKESEYGGNIPRLISNRYARCLDFRRGTHRLEVTQIGTEAFSILDYMSDGEKQTLNEAQLSALKHEYKTDLFSLLLFTLIASGVVIN